MVFIPSTSLLLQWLSSGNDGIQRLSSGRLIMLTFLIYPRGRWASTNRIPWYDSILLVCIAAPLFYGVFLDRCRSIFSRFAEEYEIILALMLFAGLLEAVRRSVGLGLTIIMLFFMIYPIVSAHMPGIFRTPGFGLDRMAYQIYLTGDGIIGMPVAVITTIVISFHSFRRGNAKTGGGRR
jgi:TRAP-type uncharacterized transport system fused permease subunit